MQPCDLLPEDADFLLGDFAGLLSRLTGLLGTTEFVRLGSGARMKLPKPLIAFGQRPFELLDGAAMGGLPITQFDFQLVHAVLGCLQFLDLGSQPVSVGEFLVLLGDMLPEDADFFLLDITGLLRRSTGLQGILNLVRLRGRQRIEFPDATVALRQGLFELLDGAAMGGLSITQFDFQLVDTASHRLQLFDLSAKAFSGGEAFVELSDLFPEDADFLLQDFAGLFGRLTRLLRRTEFIRVGSRADVKRIDPLISFGEKLFELLNPTTMSGFSVTQFHFQQMDTILC